MSEPLAALPMYARAETAEAERRFWDAVRTHAPELPSELGTPDRLFDHWLDPDLRFSQTCGMPYRTALHGRVRIVGTPDYGLPGCPPGFYNSVFVMRRAGATTDPEVWTGLCLARNSPWSESGWAAPFRYMEARGLAFDRVQATGAHRASARAVAEGAADIACIDAQTWALICDHDAIALDLAEVGRTDPAPGLPYITGPSGNPEALATAVRAAIDALTDTDRRALRIAALVDIAPETYLAVPNPPNDKADSPLTCA